VKRLFAGNLQKYWFPAWTMDGVRDRLPHGKAAHKYPFQEPKPTLQPFCL